MTFRRTTPLSISLALTGCLALDGRAPAPESPPTPADAPRSADERGGERRTRLPGRPAGLGGGPTQTPAPAPSRPATGLRKAEDKLSVASAAEPRRRALTRGPAKPLEAPSGSFAGRAVPDENPEVGAEFDRHSTFAVDVDTAAYSIARRTILGGALPTPSLVRTEEMINYFRYDYDAPTAEPFAIQLDGATSPVDATKHLLRVGIQAREVAPAARRPTNLIFLVDTSCSMTSGDKLELAKASLSIAVDQLTERDQVAITTYAGGVRLVLPPTPGSEKATIRRALAGLTSGGGTAMASGLALAYQQAAAMLRDDENTRIIVCSDGDANIGATHPEAMLKTIEGYVSEGVRISTIGFGDGNYQDAMMETIANRGNGNYYYVDTHRQAERVFGRDFTQMVEDVAQDVKIQVEFDPALVASYRLLGYENRAIADRDFRNDEVDAGEIGAGHQVTALYELSLVPGVTGEAATVRVRAKRPRGIKAEEIERRISTTALRRPFATAPADFRFAVAVGGASELFRGGAHAGAWSLDRVLSIVDDAMTGGDVDRAEFHALVTRARALAGHRGDRLSAR